jgi:DNA-binding transcriptional regulator YhcF (GntR family)
MARIQREGIAEQITKQIRDQVHAGKLRHGQALPSTRQYAEEWGVSLNTINKALAPLMEEGLIVSRDRAGRTVNAPGQSPASEEERSPKPTVPQLVLVGGYAGSGKTELGRMLVRLTGWAILDKDTTTRPVVEAALEVLGIPPSDREGDVYKNVIRPAEYEALMNTVTENIECGVSVVATAPFVSELKDKAWLDRLDAQCRALPADLTIVWVACDADSMRSYIKHRGAARDSWKLSHWDEYLGGIDLGFEPTHDHVRLDNSLGSRPLHDQARELIERIQRQAS